MVRWLWRQGDRCRGPQCFPIVCATYTYPFSVPSVKVAVRRCSRDHLQRGNLEEVEWQ
jgi:hypothetical protein